MIKKILSITGFLVLLGVLVWGGVIRTRAVYGFTGSESSISTGLETGESLSAETEVTASDWMTVEGSVQSWDGATLTVLTDSGEIILVERRSGRFLAENGFSAESGDRISLSGFYEDSTFEVGIVTNLSNGLVIRLRSDDGVPAWGGGGGE